MLTIIEAILRRHSVRTYKDSPLPTDLQSQAMAIATSSRQFLQGQTARLVPIILKETEKVGTYGLFKGSRNYFALVYKDIDRLSAVNAGMVGEAAVLAMTRLGIGTCWLGGTYSKGTVTDMVKPDADERIAAIIAFGLPAEHESLKSKMMSRIAGSRKRKHFDELFETAAETPYKDALELMRLAPSAMNGQPWRAFANSNDIDFYSTGTDGLKLLDMGIGLYHFSLEAGQGQFEHRPTQAPQHGNLHYVLSWIR